MLLPIEDFLKLRLSHSVVDVRSQGEFSQGHIRGAINIPILNDEERVAVGTDYKQKGQQEAIRTGFRLVGPRLLDIINETQQIVDGNKSPSPFGEGFGVRSEILVHCWRGGMRSSNFCQFVGMAGIKSHQLEGGYKAYRHQALESFKRPLQIILLTGCTGSGKSEVLRALKANGEQVLDLEDLAHHKGSAFGGLLMPPQPTTEQFQNKLFEEISQLDLSKRIWVEDESIAIGKIFLPHDFWVRMNESPLVQMNVSKDIRVQRLVSEYGPADRDEFLTIMGKVVTKLGGQHYNAAKEKLLQGDMTSTIDILLTYYDKAYLNSIEKRKSRLLSNIPWNGVDSNSYAQSILNLKL